MNSPNEGRYDTEEGRSGHRYKKNTYGRAWKNGEGCHKMTTLVKMPMDDLKRFYN
jgi:hypothetical protein